MADGIAPPWGESVEAEGDELLCSPRARRVLLRGPSPATATATGVAALEGVPDRLPVAGAGGGTASGAVSVVATERQQRLNADLAHRHARVLRGQGGRCDGAGGPPAGAVQGRATRVQPQQHKHLVAGEAKQLGRRRCSAYYDAGCCGLRDDDMSIRNGGGGINDGRGVEQCGPQHVKVARTQKGRRDSQGLEVSDGIRSGRSQRRLAAATHSAELRRAQGSGGCARSDSAEQCRG